MIQIIDYSHKPHFFREVAAAVSPICNTPPPAPKLSAAYYLNKALREQYRVDFGGYLQDQVDLGLEELDVVLLAGQAPLEASWLARSLPYCPAVYKCAAPEPDPVVAAIALASRGLSPLLVDLRYGTPRSVEALVEYAARRGVELQLVVTRPLDLPGELILHRSTPPYVKEKFAMAAGDISTARGPVELREIDLPGEEATCGRPSYHLALARVAEVLSIDIEFLEELAGGGIVGNDYIFDYLDHWQVGYLHKWGLLNRADGGWAASPKLIYLYGLYRKFSPSSALQQSDV